MDEIPETDQIAEAIAEHWGERCSDFEPTCWCCKAWAQYDALRAAPAEERERCAKIAATYKRDASFDDSQVGALEHNSNQANIARAILGTDVSPLLSGQE